VILLTGANGVVGRTLLARLCESNASPVRALVRREFDAVRLRDRGAEATVGDLVTGRGLDSAMRGVTTLVYLVHVLDRPGDLVGHDLAAAQNAALAARAAGVQRVVFLGHVAASDEASAQYLVARWAVERALTQSGLRSCVLRAPIVLGRGSEPFAVLRRLVDRSPVVPLFAWRRTAVEPVALADVVEALEMAIDDPELDGRSFDICGPDRTNLGTVLREYARASGRSRVFVPVRGRGETATAYAAWVLGRRPARRTRLLLETLREPQVCADPSRRFPLPHRPAALRRALADVI
jgi:uncharacterized protein YbjT (DUF2867 family)